MQVGDMYRNLVTHNVWQVKAINGRTITLIAIEPRLQCEFDTSLNLMINYTALEDGHPGT